jgi:hypothetical protein
MATQTVEFRAAPGLSLTVRLFAIGSDTIVQTASSCTEATNRKGTYAAVFTDPGAAEFELVALSGTTPVCRWFVTLTLTTATFQAYEVRTQAVVGAVGSVTNRVTANTDQWGGVAVTGMPLPTTNYTAPLSAADTRTALGLASANLDTQLSDIPTVTEFEARTLIASGYASSTHWTATRASYLDGVLLADNYNIRVVSVTGSKHIASVVHDVEPAAIPEDAFVDGALSNRVLAANAAAEVATAVRTELAIELGRIDVTSSSRLASSAYTAPDNASITLIKTVTDRLNTGLVQDGAVWQFTANMLELAPTGGGGGSATVENQQAILQHLLQIKGAGWSTSDSLSVLSDLVAAGIGSALASLGFTTGTITGFPSTLRVQDSYTQAVNRSISVYVRDSQGVPITQVGSKTFADPDFKPTCVISQDGQSGRVEALVTWVPPAGAVEGYLRIEIPSNRSAYARAGVATVQVTLRWTGIVFTLATQTVTWLPAV